MPDLSIRGQRSAEIRNRPFDGVELRASADGTGGESLTFTGYASVFEAPYSVSDWLGDYTETVKRGAFARSLAAGADVPFKVNHDGMTLARTKSGTMQLSEDARGLHVEARLDARSPHVQALRSAMERGDIDEMSFGFRVPQGGDRWSSDWMARDITEADLNKGDVSAVNYGANPATSGASLRSANILQAFRDAGAEPDDTEKLLHVLQLLSAADAAVDVAQPILAQVLNLPNPDLDAPDGPADEMKSSNFSHYALRLRALGIS